MNDQELSEQLKSEYERLEKTKDAILELLKGWSVSEIKNLFNNHVIWEAERRCKLP